MEDKDPIEVILLEYRCRDYDDRTFILRIKNAPWGASKIQQIAWGVSPNKTAGDPPVFCIYRGVTGFSPEGNEQVRNLPHEGELADYKPSFEEAFKRAYDLAKERATIYTQPSTHDPSYDPSRATLFDWTSFGNGPLDPHDPHHPLWYSPSWYPEI